MICFYLKRSNNQPFQRKDPNVGIFITDKDRLLQLKIIGLTVEDLTLIRQIKPLVEVRISEVVEAFYGTIESIPQFRLLLDSIVHQSDYAKHCVII